MSPQFVKCRSKRKEMKMNEREKVKSSSTTNVDLIRRCVGDEKENLMRIFYAAKLKLFWIYKDINKSD